MRRLTALAALAAALVVTGPGAARAAAPLSLVRVASADSPIGVLSAPGDRQRLFVVEQRARIVFFRDGVRHVFADLTSRVKGEGFEQGLLGAAFAPDYATSGKFYVYYTAPPAGPGAANGSDIVISELRRADADHADLRSERVVLRIPHRADEYENGGQMAFGPDGRLWIGTGDGGGDYDAFHNAQRLDPATDDAAAGADALLGKLLRIDPAPGDGCGGGCTIPADNPGMAQREVWAYGLRNPWRFSFDAPTGDLVIGDVGHHSYEEVDVAPAPARGRGANFGWPLYEGAHPVPDAGPAPAGCCTPPVLEHTHAEGFDAMIGGLVARDPAVPALNGRYLYASLTSGKIRAALLHGGAPATGDAGTGLAVPYITSFGQDACGHVLVTAIDGSVYRLAQGPASGCGALGLRVRAAARQGGWRTGRLRVSVGCAVRCRVTVKPSLRGVRGTRLAVVRATVSAGATRTISVAVQRSVRRALAAAVRAGRHPSIRFAVGAVAAGLPHGPREGVDARSSLGTARR